VNWPRSRVERELPCPMMPPYRIGLTLRSIASRGSSHVAARSQSGVAPVRSRGPAPVRSRTVGSSSTTSTRWPADEIGDIKAGSREGEAFDDGLALARAGLRFPFAVRQLSDGALVGSTSFLDPLLKHKRVEIGNTWYRPDTWGTRINPACKYVLMTHAFEVWGMNRVQYCTDLLNERSQAAITKLGAVREGVLRAHMVTHTGRIRDTVVFSITRREWPTVKDSLLARLVDGTASFRSPFHSRRI
jgi:RimJ/RimL family protein N-acetyltransferase